MTKKRYTSSQLQKGFMKLKMLGIGIKIFLSILILPSNIYSQDKNLQNDDFTLPGPICFIRALINIQECTTPEIKYSLFCAIKRQYQTRDRIIEIPDTTVRSGCLQFAALLDTGITSDRNTKSLGCECDILPFSFKFTVPFYAPSNTILSSEVIKVSSVITLEESVIKMGLSTNLSGSGYYSHSYSEDYIPSTLDELAYINKVINYKNSTLVCLVQTSSDLMTWKTILKCANPPWSIVTIVDSRSGFNTGKMYYRVIVL